jgi:hypothetical protein
MGSLWQGKTLVVEFFFQMELMAHMVGVNLEESGHVILQIE